MDLGGEGLGLAFGLLRQSLCGEKKVVVYRFTFCHVRMLLIEAVVAVSVAVHIWDEMVVCAASLLQYILCLCQGSLSPETCQFTLAVNKAISLYLDALMVAMVSRLQHRMYVYFSLLFLPPLFYRTDPTEWPGSPV